MTRLVRSVSQLSLLGTLALSALATRPANAEVPNGAKVVFQDLGAQGVKPHEAAAVTTAACHALGRRPTVEVVCGDDLRALFQWNAMAAALSSCSDEQCFESAGKALAARFVVSGSVAQIGQEFVLSLSMFDVEKASAAGRSEIRADSIESLYKQVSEAIDGLLEDRGAKKKRAT